MFDARASQKLLYIFSRAVPKLGILEFSEFPSSSIQVDFVVWASCYHNYSTTVYKLRRTCE